MLDQVLMLGEGLMLDEGLMGKVWPLVEGLWSGGASDAGLRPDAEGRSDAGGHI